MKKTHVLSKLSSALAVTAIFSWADVQAEQMMQHDMGKHQDRPAMSNMTDKMFMSNSTVDGYDVSFHVMVSPDGQNKDGSHHFMIKVAKHGEAISSLRVNSKIIGPDGQSQSHPMMSMGDWFMAAYDMNGEGRYQLLVLFETPDKKIHKSGVYYPN